MTLPVNFELMASTSIASSVQSNPFRVDRLVDGAFSVQAIVTGNAVGTMKVQCSNDAGAIPEAGEQAATGIKNWDDVAGGSVAVAGVAPYTIDLSGRHFKWARVSYVAVSGAGTMAIRVNGTVAR